MSRANREVLTELNALHANALRRMPWIQAGVVLALVFVVYDPALSWQVGTWAVLSLAVEVSRAGYALFVLRGAERLDPTRVHRRFVALAALSGSVMGAGAALVLHRLPVLDQAMIGIFVFAMPAGGVAVSQSSRYIVAAYSGTILLPPAVVWILLHRSQSVTVGVGTFIYWMLMILVAADGDRLLLRSVLIRHQRDRLVQDLERKNAEVQQAVARAEAAALARARVLAAASHDLRQPLHALSVYGAVLTAQPAPEVLAEVGAHVVDIVRSLGSVLNGLLDLSRLSSGYYVPERTACSLDRIVAAVCAESAASARARQLSLEQDCQPVLVHSDAVALTRIARNLIDNAIKYTDQGGVRVATGGRLVEGRARAFLRVADTGRGIAPEDQERVFEEFYQLGNPGRDRSQGVGLGLAIVQRLCEVLDAQVSVTSAAGAGSTFEVTLPLVEAPAAVAEPAPSLPQSDGPIGGRRVYVIDDEQDVLRGTRTLLEMWGLEVHGAVSAAAAEQLCRNEGVPDLMIADLRLGEAEHGAQLAVRLRATYGYFPVLIISGETSSAALDEATQRSFTLLQKPVAPEVFRSALQAALRHRLDGEAGAGAAHGRGL